MVFFQTTATFLPYIFLWGFFLFSAFAFFIVKDKKEKLPQLFRRLFWAGISFRIVYAVFLTVGQYIFWNSSAATKIFLNQGIDSNGPIGGITKIFPLLQSGSGYFIFYVFIHFWVSAFLAIFCAALFWWFLKILHKYQERFFDEGEKELGAVMALLAGWPGFIPFLIFTFLSVILISIIRGIFYKEPYTTLSLPFLIAVLVVLLFGKIFLVMTGLSVLHVTNISW